MYLLQYKIIRTVFFIHIFRTMVSHEEYFLKPCSKQTFVGELFEEHEEHSCYFFCSDFKRMCEIFSIVFIL